MPGQAMLRLTLLLLATFALPASVKSAGLRIAGKKDGALRTGITVAAALDKSPQRPLVVWWEGAAGAGWLGLWASDPRQGDGTPLATRNLTDGDVAGWWDTGVSAEDSHAELPSFQPTDLGRWAGFVPSTARDAPSAVQGVSSLSTRPRWMEEHRAVMGALTMPHIFLPGTHDSGAYKLFSSAEDALQPRLTLIDKYSVAQEESIIWQLVFGVRYLDLRVAYYPLTTEVWWVNHGVVRFWPLTEVLQEILSFMQNTNEIVVLDFHEFPVGFRKNGRRIDDVHQELVAFLRQQLGSTWAAPGAGWYATSLEDLWASGRRLLLSYNDAATVAANKDFLWSAVSQKWGNVRTLEDLHNHLQNLYNSPPTEPWAAMAELTPNTLDVILDRLGGLRSMADLVNRNVTAWYRGNWGQTVNAVAVDFFRGTAIVEAAIDWNLQRTKEVWKIAEGRHQHPPQLF